MQLPRSPAPPSYHHSRYNVTRKLRLMFTYFKLFEFSLSSRPLEDGDMISIDVSVSKLSCSHFQQLFTLYWIVFEQYVSASQFL